MPSSVADVRPHRFQARRGAAIVAALILLHWFVVSVATADLIIDFENAVDAAQFDGDVAGQTAGPFIIDFIPTTFTTHSVSGAIGTSSFGLGINGGVGDPDTESFNIGETWSVSSDQNLFIKALELGGLQSEETFSIQSDNWINLSGINPGTGVTYEAATGSFFLTDGPAGDVFSLSTLTGGTTLHMRAGSIITFGGLTSTFGPNDDVELENITFEYNAIPEPASGLVGLLGLIALAGTRYSRRQLS